MWAVLQKAIYDSRRTAFWLSVGLGLYAIFVVSLFPSIAKNADSYKEMVESMPKEFTGLFGGDAASLDLASPAGFISIEFFIWTVLILGAVVIIQAFNAVTNAERDGTLDVMMAFPVSRRDVLIARFLNTLLTLLVVLTVIFLCLWLSTALWDEFALSFGELARMSYGPLLILLPYATFCYALACTVPSSKRWAGTLAYTLFFGMYFIHGLAGVSDSLKSLQPFLLFDYYNATQIANEGVAGVKVVVMTALTAVFGGLAWWQIDQKELGV